MKEKYVLMNQNTEVLKFEFDKDLNVITNIEEIYNIEYAPLNIKNIDEEKRVIELNNWFNERGIPVYRDNVKEIIEIFGVSNIKELTSRDYALSLSDQYWFKPVENSNLQWEDINYFDKDYNSFSFADATYGSGAGTTLKQTSNEHSDRTPNNTANGQLKKVWIKQNNESYLYKGAGTIHNFEPINEVLASKICEILEVPYVEYYIDIIHSKRQDNLVSVCKCIIDKNEEIIPAHSILTEEKGKITKTIEDYYTYLQILKKHNVPNAEEYLQKMFLLDYIMLNEDRHLNNFGIIRDVQTLEWKRICPIFDTGRSMNTNVTTSYWDFKEGEVKCFTKELISSKKLEKILKKDITDSQIEKLKELADFYRSMLVEYKNYTKLSDEEINKLYEGYKKRIECLEEIFQWQL